MAEPPAKAAVEGAAGYAVFSNTGLKILVAGGGKGEGIAVYNKSKGETFMKMLELQAGFGMGVKKFRVVFVFDTDKALTVSSTQSRGFRIHRSHHRNHTGTLIAFRGRRPTYDY